ncbi:MAG: HAD-IA family hydrolase [Pseudomonadales bacterium]|nr:HAD-IA family hydrolase [Halioglobus sp.]MCP5128793.1 HAD-IA family hydrolase [Pseudomonadales bacterium]
MNIVFDLDGTLIDSAPDIQSMASAVLERWGRDELSLDETRNFVGEGAANFVTRMMAARGIENTEANHAALYGEFIVQYEFALDKAVFYPAAFETLSLLKAAGHGLGLCTNKPERPARAVIRHMGLEPLFDAVMAGGMINSRKPEPDMLLRTIDQLGNGPTLYVGDSEIDASTARRAGVPFALFTRGYRKAPVSQIHQDWAFDDFSALPGIVAEAEGRALPSAS